MKLPLAPGILLLLALSAVAAVLGNAVSPAGIDWAERFDDRIRVRALQAGVQPLDPEELDRMIGEPGVLLLDARPWADFAEGRLPGALSLPWGVHEEALRARRAAVFGSARVVVYCGSAFCSSGIKLATWLRGQGMAGVSLYDEGFDLWEESGRPVERD